MFHELGAPPCQYDLEGISAKADQLEEAAEAMSKILAIEAKNARPDVIEKCLNHVEQNKIVRIYQRQELKAEQAEAWRLLGERLELLLRNNADNVMMLKKTA